MKRNRFTVERTIGMLREAEVRTSQDKSVVHVSRELGIMEQTCYPLEERVLTKHIFLYLSG